MTDLPYVILSCAMSLDGFIDDATPERLLISNDLDFDRVDEVRASVDGILVGANTVRRDNPRLLVRSEQRRNARRAAGRSANPTKVILTRFGGVNPDAAVFSGEAEKIVYCSGDLTEEDSIALSKVATVVTAEESHDLTSILGDLFARGVRILMVEGGSSIHTQFLESGLVDEVHLAVGPFLVGDATAPRFVQTGTFPFDKDRRGRLLELRAMGDVAFMRFGFSDRQAPR